ncbi:DMT family transporter, partial [Nguyenibacter vanlangensis]
MQYAALFFISALWGGSFVLIKVLSVDLSSFSISVERTFIAAAALSVLAFTRKRTVHYGGWAWRRLACLALVGQVVPFTLLSVAGHLTTSINLAFMMGAAPLVTFAMSAIFPPREHWNALTVLGLLLGGIGVGASLYSPSIPTISSYHVLTHSTLGQMAALGAAASFAAGAIISRNLSSRMDSFLVVTHSMCISAFVLAVSALLGKLIFSTNISLPSDGRELTTHQFHPDAHNGGIGLRNWRSLTMRRTPRVNQESLL